jgi:hypothetical protein
MSMNEILRCCINEYGSISKKKYGKHFDLAAIEKTVHDRKLSSKRNLIYSDLQFFKAREHWWFEKFWVFPPAEAIHPALQEKTLNFWNLPKEEAKLISELLDIFKSIELVSIILRFINPRDYGIMSPPVERILDVRRGSDAIETYLNYVGNLREIAKCFDFKRCADVDMALWVLHEKCYGQFRDFKIETAYGNDPVFLHIRAKNLVMPLAGLSRARLAEALPREMNDLAALIACSEFEKQISRVFRLLSPDSIKQKLEDIINDLPNYGPIDQIRKKNWHRFRKIRNRLFHEDQHPTDKETVDLIQEVIHIEQDFEDLKMLKA